MTKLFLKETTRLVMLQFSFSNPKAIPYNIRKREPETKNEHVRRVKLPPRGRLAIEPSERTKITSFAMDLETNGYQLVDGFSQKRHHAKRPEQVYYAVRFTFARKEYAEISDEFQSIQTKIHADLKQVCTVAFWRTRAFSNPFYKNGEEVEGFETLSFNFEVRSPRFHPDKKPILARRKDEQGNKFGDPVPLEPLHRLTLINGVVNLR